MEREQSTNPSLIIDKADIVTVKGHNVLTEDQKHLESKTTVEEDLHSASQRFINNKWETVQANISQAIVLTTCIGVITSIVSNLFGIERTIAFPAEWWTILGLVIGFYFGRTNHARVGGVQIGR
jgi:hypothetical protein